MRFPLSSSHSRSVKDKNGVKEAGRNGSTRDNVSQLHLAGCWRKPKGVRAHVEYEF